MKSKYTQISNLEKKFTILLLVYFCDVLTPFSLVEKILAIASYIFIIINMFFHWKKLFYYSLKDLFLLLLLAWATVSFFWSFEPSNTLITIRAILRITCFGIYFAMRYDLKEQLKLLMWAFGISILICFLVGYFTQTPEGWQGGFNQKNVMARTMVLSMFTFAISASSDKKHKLIKWFCCFLSLVLVILSQGKTALVMIFIVVFLWTIRKVFKQFYLIKVPLFILFSFLTVGITGWVISSYEFIVVDILGKDLALNGRTFLWIELISKVQERPWSGYGLFGFWNETNIRSLEKTVKYGWVPTNAHCGFLDLTLFLGFIGLILFMFSFIRAYINAITLTFVSQEKYFSWPLVFLTLMFLYNINDVITILSPFDISWLLYVSTVILISETSNVGKLKMNAIVSSRE